MAFNINGSPVTSISVGGVECTDVMVGSTHAWCTPPLPDHYDVIKEGTSGSGFTYQILFYIINTSKKTVSYKITYSQMTKTISIASHERGVAAFDVRLPPAANKSICAEVEYLGRTLLISNPYGNTIVRA